MKLTLRFPRSPRSTGLLIVGLAGITAETVYSLRYRQSPDSTLTLGFLAMMGLPVFFATDKDNDDDDDHGEAHRHIQEPSSGIESPTPGPDGT